MHMLTGLNQPTNGTGRVIGFDIRTEYEQIKRHIGYMSQKFSLYDDLTVAENISLFAGIYGMKDDEIRRKTDALLERLNFSEHRNTLVANLPLGWKQKLAFSVSIFHEPGIVFLDEPTGGVDPATRRQFWELIYDAAERGITVFVTTHYMDEAEYCDRISIMVDGKIKALGTPDETKADTQSTRYGPCIYLFSTSSKAQFRLRLPIHLKQTIIDELIFFICYQGNQAYSSR